MTDTFRAVWPITDDTVPWHQLVAEAYADLENVAARYRVRIDPDAQPRVFRAPASLVPGSGGLTDTVLVFDVRATPIKPRPYHRRSTAA